MYIVFIYGMWPENKVLLLLLLLEEYNFISITTLNIYALTEYNKIHNCDRGDPLETQRAYDEDHQDI